MDGTPRGKYIRMTEDRDKWRKYVYGVADPRIEDGYRTESYLCTGHDLCSAVKACLQLISSNERQFANSSVNNRIGIHVFRTD